MKNKINIKAIIKLLRPKQWVKNSFVLAAIIFSGKFLDTNILAKNIAVMFMFCLTSSCVYILNDIIDVEKDRCHPKKKFRPIASGDVSITQAVILGIILLLIVVLGTYKINPLALIIIVVYLVLNVLYSFKLKHIIIIDVMVITLGFVLRIECGSVVASVSLSPWLILCTILLSLFLALNKRKSEIIELDTKGASHRKILEDYSVDLIDRMLNLVTPSILISYCLYTFNSVQSRNMMLTIPFIIYGIFRYEYLMTKNNAGGKPEDVFFKDKPFLINIILWGVSILTIIYFKNQF
jgi:4-hydroxybenzoate polyprenyltransferase